MRGVITCCILLLLVSAIPCPAQVKSPCSDLKPEKSEYGYKQLPGRCEGFFVPKYSSVLQVVSFVKGTLDYELVEKTLLNVQAVSKGRAVNIRAVSQARNIHYRMDAPLNPGQVLQWPVAPYLLKKSVGAKDLGVYAWEGSETDKIFSPVIVKSSPAISMATDTLLSINIIPVSDLTHFRWRLIRYDQVSGCLTDAAISDFIDYKDDKYAGAIVKIGSPLLSKEKKTICMEIRYRPDKKKWESELIKMNLAE